MRKRATLTDVTGTQICEVSKSTLCFLFLNLSPSMKLKGSLCLNHVIYVAVLCARWAFVLVTCNKKDGGNKKSSRQYGGNKDESSRQYKT